MWPQTLQVIQFDTRQLEIEAALGLYGEREAAAHAALNRSRGSARRLPQFFRRLPWRPAPAPCVSC